MSAPIVLNKDQMRCVYCTEKADGPMLYMGTYLAVGQPALAHTQCVQERLDKLLNPEDTEREEG